jgi:hypothetical protein
LNVRVWGDGFHDDKWHHLLALKSWDRCDPDEMIRVFPQLLDGNGPAEAVRTRLVEGVAVLSRRLRMSDGVDEPRSLSAEELESQGRSASARWFGRSMDFASWRPFGGARSRDRDRAALRLLDELAVEIARGDLRPFEPAAALEVAYWSGIHPVYLWPEALLDHALFTAVGWIGHAERYGQALMTQDIAEFFGSTLYVTPDGAVETRDARLRLYVRSSQLAQKILKGAQQTLEGQVPVVRLRRRLRDIIIDLRRIGRLEGVYPGARLADEHRLVEGVPP